MWWILPKSVLQYFLEKIKSKFLLIRNHDILGAKNILPFPYTYGSGTSHGLTVTVNEDGSVTAQGTPTQNVSFSLNSNIINALDLSIGDKVIFSEWEVDNQSAFAALLLNPSTAISEVRGDYTLTVTSEMVQDGVSFILFFSNGVDLTTPVTFKPMVRLATDPDSTWYSPALTNKQLTDQVFYLNHSKSHVSANPSTTTGTLTGIEIDGNTYAIQGGGHTIKNDSGTTLANKSNLKFAGTYSANVGDDTVVNIVREMLEDDYDLLSADEKKGFIDVTDEADDVLADVAVTGEYSDILNRPIMGENTFKVTRGQSQSTATAGYWAAMVHRTGGGSPITPTNGWWHVISMDWEGDSVDNWISQLAIPTQDNTGVYYRRNPNGGDSSIDNQAWTRLADADANGYANVANLLNGFINPCGADNNGSNTFTYDFLANRMYIVTLGGVGGGGAHFLNGSIYLVWCNENNTTGGFNVSALRTGSYSITGSTRAQSGTNKWTLTANTSVRWNVYPFLG